jgi:sugar phosphate isomerase/epimerase
MHSIHWKAAPVRAYVGQREIMSEIVWFTKFLKGLDAEGIAASAAAVGVDGLDLAVRAGHLVEPANVREALPRALAVWRRRGLSVPLVTLEGGATDPDAEAVRAVFAACGDAGIPCIKLGYWIWKPAARYWIGVDAVRRALEGFERLGREHGVCALVHTHSDEYYGSNAAGAMHLVRGFDPRHVGVCLDPAHLALDGEHLPMAIDMVREHLRFVAVKNARHLPAAETPVGPRWTVDWCGLAEGLVHWPSALAALRAAGYSGAFSLHGEYSASEERDAVREFVGRDAHCFRRCLAGAANHLRQGAHA